MIDKALYEKLKDEISRNMQDIDLQNYFFETHQANLMSRGNRYNQFLQEIISASEMLFAGIKNALNKHCRFVNSMTLTHEFGVSTTILGSSAPLSVSLYINECIYLGQYLYQKCPSVRQTNKDFIDVILTIIFKTLLHETLHSFQLVLPMNFNDILVRFDHELSVRLLLNMIIDGIYEDKYPEFKELSELVDRTPVNKEFMIAIDSSIDHCSLFNYDDLRSKLDKEKFKVFMDSLYIRYMFDLEGYIINATISGGFIVKDSVLFELLEDNFKALEQSRELVNTFALNREESPTAYEIISINSNIFISYLSIIWKILLYSRQYNQFSVMISDTDRRNPLNVFALVKDGYIMPDIFNYLSFLREWRFNWAVVHTIVDIRPYNENSNILEFQIYREEDLEGYSCI